MSRVADHNDTGLIECFSPAANAVTDSLSVPVWLNKQRLRPTGSVCQHLVRLQRPMPPCRR